jgi:hypothetical protein
MVTFSKQTTIPMTTTDPQGDPSSSTTTPTSGLVLWNRFEVKDDVLLSEVGPDIQLRNYKIDNWAEANIIPGKFGNGLYVIMTLVALIQMDQILLAQVLTKWA